MFPGRCLPSSTAPSGERIKADPKPSMMPHTRFSANSRQYRNDLNSVQKFSGQHAVVDRVVGEHQHAAIEKLRRLGTALLPVLVDCRGAINCELPTPVANREITSRNADNAAFNVTRVTHLIMADLSHGPSRREGRRRHPDHIIQPSAAM